ncbi:MAG TPA: transcription antitermination factor NusB, partial [Bacteroidia bacterium]|nr:transcription antitermination factor NusB [Bacteroidia bacterium]
MQALYSFFQHEKADLAHFEKELFKSLDKIYELYLSILALVNDLHHVSMVMVDESRNKRLPNEADLNPNLKFVNNSLLVSLSN